MAIPATPTAFSVYYVPDWYANVCDITAGDTTHDGFYVYRYYNNGTTLDWHQYYTINSTSTSLVSEYIGGDNTTTADPYRVTAFNTFGESAPLTAAGAPAETATPTNLQFTRNGLEVTVTWDGTLESGDSWEVGLVDPFGPPTITTVTANTETLLTGRWADRDVWVRPTNTPANEATIIITKSIPTHTAVTNLVSKITASNGIVDDYNFLFSCDWLQERLLDPANGWLSPPTTRIFYSLTGDDSNFIESSGGDIGNGNFDYISNLAILPEGQAYLVTVEIETNEATSPRPTHVLTTTAAAELLTVSLTHVSQDNYSDGTTDGSQNGYLLYHTDSVSLYYTQTPGTLNVEFESKIDDSAWVPLLIHSAYETATINIHEDSKYSYTSGSYSTSPDNLGTNELDHTHFYEYSDGFLYDEYPDDPGDPNGYPHYNTNPRTVQVRGRGVGTTDWMYSNQVMTPLRSRWHVSLVEPEWVEKEFTYARISSGYFTFEGNQQPSVKYTVRKYTDEVYETAGYIDEYVNGKTKQMFFTIDRGIIGFDQTDLRSGPQPSWIYTASSSLPTNTPDKAMDDDPNTSWKSAVEYSRKNKRPITSPEWWQCDFGEELQIIALHFSGAMPIAFSVYGSTTGTFTGEEVLIHTAQYFAISLGDIIFDNAHTVRYVRIYIDRLDINTGPNTPLYPFINEVSFYVGDFIYEQSHIDIETPIGVAHWFAMMPQEKLDGQNHLIRFKWVITNPDTSVWKIWETADFNYPIPNKSALAIPKTHINIVRVS